MSAESPGASDRISRWRESFRAWRWQRPFWAGLLSLLAGVPIMYFPYNDVNAGGFTINMSTTAGSASLIIGVLLVVLGLTMWFQPMVRVFAGVATILLGLVSIPVSNFGGFLMGFLLALFGGGMSISWAPGETPSAQPAEKPGAAPQDDGNGDNVPEPAGAGSAPDQEARNGRHRAG